MPTIGVSDRTTSEGLLIKRYASSIAGPRIVMMGGVHGDEAFGSVVVNAWQSHQDLANLRGCLELLAVANPYAWSANSRETPWDGKNLARCFPGSERGSLTDRLASNITSALFSGADLVIDIHSGGSNWDMPLFCGYLDDGSPAAKRAAEVAGRFGAPLTWRHLEVGPGRSLSAAAALGVSAIYIEAHGGGSILGSELDATVRGLDQVFKAMGSLPGEPAPQGPSTVLSGGDGNIDAAVKAGATGYVVTRANPGDEVSPDQCLAEIWSDEGEVVDRVTAPGAGYLMLLSRRRKVQVGDVVAMVAPQGPA